MDIHYVAAEAGKPSRVELTSGRGKLSAFEHVAAFDPSADKLAEYAGAYSSEEIDPTFRISLQDGKLTLNQIKRKPETLRPVTQDLFVCDTGAIRFTRGADRQISASSSTATGFKTSSSQEKLISDGKGRTPIYSMPPMSRSQKESLRTGDISPQIRVLRN